MRPMRKCGTSIYGLNARNMIIFHTSQQKLNGMAYRSFLFILSCFYYRFLLCKLEDHKPPTTPYHAANRPRFSEHASLSHIPIPIHMSIFKLIISLSFFFVRERFIWQPKRYFSPPFLPPYNPPQMKPITVSIVRKLSSICNFWPRSMFFRRCVFNG